MGIGNSKKTHKSLDKKLFLHMNGGQMLTRCHRNVLVRSSTIYIKGHSKFQWDISNPSSQIYPILNLVQDYLVSTYDLDLSSFLFSHDITQAGYALGKPEGRSTDPFPERGLSPAGCCLVRAIMHSALLWASCNNEVE